MQDSNRIAFSGATKRVNSSLNHVLSHTAKMLRKTARALSLLALANALLPPRNHVRRRVATPNANPFDEILDALDSMVGVSPLSEADMKSGLTSEELAARAAAKAEDAPPADALEKQSVSIFFALLGLFPVAIMVAGLANGAKPFGL